ncbi:hypothetical protein B296_00006192 [Ensete ventricosum]|uniref:Uncharacterized protein n=1 Tax=Ensete ventricosum TaxID=4639 RepID=A0A427APD3_ENSVE|nr:hypothetical protein B296_00006192 [Ensete ventricosum]
MACSSSLSIFRALTRASFSNRCTLARLLQTSLKSFSEAPLSSDSTGPSGSSYDAAGFLSLEWERDSPLSCRDLCLLVSTFTFLCRRVESPAYSVGASTGLLDEAFEASLAGETSTSRATVRVEEALPPNTLGIPCNSPRSIRSTSRLKGEILHHLRHSSMSGCRGNRRLASRASTEIHMPGASELSLKTLASTSDGGPEDAPEEPTLGSPRLAPPDPGEEMTLTLLEESEELPEAKQSDPTTRAGSLGSTHPTELQLYAEATASELAHMGLNQQYLLSRYGDRPRLQDKRQISPYSP